MAVHNRPVPTEIYESVGSFVPAAGSVYIAGYSVEERSHHIAHWREQANGVELIDVILEERNTGHSERVTGTSTRCV